MVKNIGNLSKRNIKVKSFASTDPEDIVYLAADDEEDVRSAHPVKIPAKKCDGRVRNRPQSAGDHDEIHRPRLGSPTDRTDVAL